MDDEILAQAAEKAAAIIGGSLPQECTHSFSAAFQRKMNRILRRQRHPALYCCLRSAAVFLLVLTACFGSLLALSAEAREFVFGWVRERFSSGYVYSFAGESSPEDFPRYCLDWIPEGHALLNVDRTDGGEAYVYSDENGGLTVFEYSTGQQNEALYLFQGDDYQQQEVTINGLPGTMYISPREVESSGIVWVDNASETIFVLTAHVSPDVLIQMAEGVVSKK